MKNTAFCDVILCGSCKNQRFGGTFRPIIRLTRIGELGITLAVIFCDLLQLLVTANDVPSTLVLFTLMMEALHSSKTSVLTRVILRTIPEDGILQPTYYCSRIMRLQPEGNTNIDNQYSHAARVSGLSHLSPK
jgi:hypothetical protein